MKNITRITIMVMVLILTVGYVSYSVSTATTASSTTSAEDSAEDVVVSTTSSVEDAENVVCPEIVPESSVEMMIMRDIEEAKYYVWLPGDKPQTRWRRSKEVSNTFMLTEDTAIVEYNGILSFGMPDETGTVYVLANLASISAIREVCSDAELKGAERVIVCDIHTISTWFRDFTERRM